MDFQAHEERLVLESALAREPVGDLIEPPKRMVSLFGSLVWNAPKLLLSNENLIIFNRSILFK